MSNEDAHFYRAEYGISAERVAVIPHAIQDVFFEDVAAKRNLDQLLFVGTWLHRKGVDILEAALPVVLRRNPSVTVVIAGTLSPRDEILAKFPRDVVPRVTVHPCLNDMELRSLYLQSGLLLVPSRLEGLPFVLLEAMAGGCPALAANNSGMRDVIVPGVNGWVLDGFDSPAWANRISELLRDVPGRRAAIEGAREASHRFELLKVTRESLAWYESLS